MNNKRVHDFELPDRTSELTNKNFVIRILFKQHATSSTARSINSVGVIQTVHSFLMRRFSSSTSDILVRALGERFEYAV